MMYLTYIGLALGCGMIVFSAGYSISSIAKSAIESIARQPEAASEIRGAMGLPLFLLEGVSIISLLIFFLIVSK